MAAAKSTNTPLAVEADIRSMRKLKKNTKARGRSMTTHFSGLR